MKRFSVKVIRKFKLSHGSDYFLFIPKSCGLTTEDASELIGIFKENFNDVVIVFVDSAADIKILEKKIKKEPPRSERIIASDISSDDFGVEDMFVDRPTAADVAKRGTAVEQAEEAMAETLREMGEKPKSNDESLSGL